MQSGSIIRLSRYRRTKPSANITLALLSPGFAYKRQQMVASCQKHTMLTLSCKKPQLLVVIGLCQYLCSSMVCHIVKATQ